MIAEIYGKISSDGSTFNERLEDDLTGNIFGTLRYIPFDLGLGAILSSAISPRMKNDEIFESIQLEYWDDKIKFWPFDDLGELDALIEFDDLIIGIEVKYHSGLSDKESEFDEESGISVKDKLSLSKEASNGGQLTRESKIISQRGRNKRKILLFIAKNSVCKSVYEYTIQHNHVLNGVELRYISWEVFHDQLSKMQLENPFYNLIINDLVRLLKRKKLVFFNDMMLGDMYAIDSDAYFIFNGSVKSKFDFETNDPFIVKGELYYEFRGKYKKRFIRHV